MSKRKKKSKRARSQSQRSVASPASQALQTLETPSDSQANSQEYAYVNKDLRQVTILAAAMFALLIALSFFIG